MAASKVTCASFNIGTNALITIVKDKSSYTHTITFKFGKYTGTIATKTTQTSIVWSPAAASLYAEIPNAVSGYGTITCQTYDGNTLIGTATAGFYAYAVKENCLPTVSIAVEDTNDKTIALTGNKNNLICYMSKPKVTLTAAAKNSATIKSIQSYNPVGLVADTSPYTFDTVYSQEFRGKAVDSRGYITEETYNVPSFILYDPAHFLSVDLRRVETTSTTARATLSGFCFNGSFGAVNNSLTLKYRYKSTGEYGSYVTINNPTWNNDGSFNATVDIPNLTLNELYTFEFVVEDKLTSYSFSSVLGQSVGDLRIGKDYAQFKNDVRVGDVNNTDWKCFSARRKISGRKYRGNFGVGFGGTAGAAILELYEAINNVESQVARIELRNDKHLYNLFTSMSFAEMMASAPSNNLDGSQGYLILNGGSSSPVLMMWGLVHVTPSGANVPTSKRVNFNNQFKGTPFVNVSKLTSVPKQMTASANNISEAGFDLVFDRTNTVTTSVAWFAIGNGSNALPE